MTLGRIVSFDLRVRVEHELPGQNHLVLRPSEFLLLVAEVIAVSLGQLEKAQVAVAKLLNKCRMRLLRQNSPSTYCPMKAVQRLRLILILQHLG
jgi:hypothetical protein